jgi:hypothetical protein
MFVILPVGRRRHDMSGLSKNIYLRIKGMAPNQHTQKKQYFIHKNG